MVGAAAKGLLRALREREAFALMEGDYEDTGAEGRRRSGSVGLGGG